MSNKDDQKVFRKVPITWVPFLDEDPANPVYGTRWSRVALDEAVSLVHAAHEASSPIDELINDILRDLGKPTMEQINSVLSELLPREDFPRPDIEGENEHQI